jgi:thioredoxin-like negative regulator of GroEL
VQPEWRTLLESSVRTPGGDHWLSWWHLGNLRMEARDLDGAEEAWERSLALRPTGWALRNLAVAAKRRGETHEALERMDRAWSQGPKVVSLAVEYAQELVTAERFGDVLRLVSSLPERLRAHDRVRLLWAKAALETGELDGVERIFDHEFATIREGEVTLTDLWFALHERRVATAEGVPIDSAVRARVRREFPPPRHIDFRMADERQEGAGRPNVE